MTVTPDRRRRCSSTRANGRPSPASHGGVPRPERAGFPFALLLVLVLPLGCVNPFKPADPEIGGGGIPVAENFRTPEGLFTTVELAIEAKSTSGASAYLNAFADSTVPGDRAFRAFYDPAVRVGWESGSLTAPEPWDLSLERGLHTSLAGIRQQDAYDFRWTKDNSLVSDEFPAGADTGHVQWKYLLFSKSPTSGSDTQGEIIAVGYCDLSLQLKNSRWSIFRWVDRVDPAVGVNPAAGDQRTFTWWRLKSLSR